MVNHELLKENFIDFFMKEREGDMVAADLTFKTYVMVDDGLMKRRVNLNKALCTTTVQKFLSLLNTKVYGNAAKKYNKKLFCVPVLEGGTDSIKYHLHLTIWKPERLSDYDFEKLITKLWLKTMFGNRIMKIENVYDEKRRHEYVLKRRTKCEDIQSSILFEAT